MTEEDWPIGANEEGEWWAHGPDWPLGPYKTKEEAQDAVKVVLQAMKDGTFAEAL